MTNDQKEQLFRLLFIGSVWLVGIGGIWALLSLDGC